MEREAVLVLKTLYWYFYGMYSWASCELVHLGIDLGFTLALREGRGGGRKRS